MPFPLDHTASIEEHQFSLALPEGPSPVTGLDGRGNVESLMSHERVGGTGGGILNISLGSLLMVLRRPRAAQHPVSGDPSSSVVIKVFVCSPITVINPLPWHKLYCVS